MSYSSHRRAALDSGKPLPHRISHARSCAVVVAEKYRVSRESIIALVGQLCGVDLMAVQQPEALSRAIAALDRIRLEGLATNAEPSASGNIRLGQ